MRLCQAPDEIYARQRLNISSCIAQITIVSPCGQMRRGTALTGFTPGLNGGVSGSGNTFNQRPNRVSPESCRPRSGPPEQSINPLAFTLADFQIGSPGNSAAGVCEGPGMFQTDLALYKNINTTSKVKIQFRFEIFNVFNRTNFIFVNTAMNPTAVTFDSADVADATKITSFVLASNFGQATAARSTAGAVRNQIDLLIATAAF